jgi:hypothetical protein
MNDITAVVLTIGEETTPRALASVRAQSYEPAETILVDGVMPFHKALNRGASRVRTEFFIQVDADMVLDRHCMEDLRGFMTPGVGVVQGPLADPLLGAVSGVRVFRTICFREVAVRDTIAPDTDFFKDIAARGWERKVVLGARPNGRAAGLWHTFGRHDPSYTPLYTYWKFLLTGARCRYRGTLAGVQWRLRQFDRCPLPVALIGQVALAHGVFLDARHDLLMPYGESADLARLERLLACSGSARVRGDDVLPLLNLPAEAQFRDFCQLGSRLAGERDGGGLRSCLELLQGVPVEQSWLARVGLGHGVFLDRARPDQLREDYAMVRELGADGRETAPFGRGPVRSGLRR